MKESKEKPYAAEHAPARTAPDVAPPAAGDEPAAESLDALRKARDEFRDKFLRAQAECANISKRLHQQHAELLKHAGIDIVRSLLAIVDNLERSVEGLTVASVDSALVQGIQLIVEQFHTTLRGHGVEPIEALGHGFDPSRHEALSSDPNADAPAGTVVEEFQRGYEMNGRVVRHAKVVVSAKPEEPGNNA